MLKQLGDVRDLRRQMLQGAVLPQAGWRLIRSEMTWGNHRQNGLDELGTTGSCPERICGSDNGWWLLSDVVKR